MKPAFTNFYLFLVLFGSTIVRASIIPKVSGVNTEIVAPTNKNEELSSHFINVMKESIPNEYIVMFKKNVKSYQIQAHFKHLQVISNLHGKFFDLNTFKIEPFQIGRNTEYSMYLILQLFLGYNELVSWLQCEQPGPLQPVLNLPVCYFLKNDYFH